MSMHDAAALYRRSLEQPPVLHWSELSEEEQAGWVTKARALRDNHPRPVADPEWQVKAPEPDAPKSEELWLPTKEEYLAAGREEDLWEAFQSGRKAEYEAIGVCFEPLPETVPDPEVSYGELETEEPEDLA